jgi:SRSO17 transposase
MDFLDSEGQARLTKYFDMIGELLGNKSRQESFAMYAMGLLGDGERKSVEPIAARACADPDRMDALHQRLLHFTANADWSDADVRREAARYALSALTAREPVVAWILDDTGFLKQGKHSVGVQRQYTGSAGKTANCQIGVSLTVATPTEHLPVDFELYLPISWTSDPDRRAEARIPAEVEFKTKPELALEMVRRAVRDDLPRGVVLADSGYGNSTEFRRGIRDLGLHYAAGILPQTTVFTVPGDASSDSRQVGVKDLAMQLEAEGAFRRCTWRQGTRAPLSARFVRRRVLATSDPREELWLLIEWRDGESEPSNYFLSTLPKAMSIRNMVRIVMQRWRIERTYEDLKGELGLDHYEGRRFRGWHHHVSVALCCYAFIVAERARLFPPSAGGTQEAWQERGAA